MSSIKDYMWRTVCMSDLHPDLKGVGYKLKHWPDFGALDYKNEFVDICALLSVRFVTLQELQLVTGAEEKLIHHVLNTLKATGLLDTTSLTEGDSHRSELINLSDFQKKVMSFIRKAYRRNAPSEGQLVQENI